jgi:trehalose 6-phosphate phosphatase
MTMREGGTQQGAAMRDIDAQQVPAFDRNWCFFLDIDGTLIEFAERPNAVLADAGIKAVLRRLLGAASGAVALISGRSIADIDRVFAPLRFPAAGQHGLERRDDGGNLRVHTAPMIHLQDAAEKLERLVALHPDLVLENKGASLALHYRLAPHLASEVDDAMRELLGELGDEFELLSGKMLVEIKLSGKDKGTAIAEFMAERPFSGRTPVFIGDDVTDEYGFALVNSRRGHSVKVGSGASAARWRLADARAVRAWLAAFAGRYSNQHDN